ncbi:MAG: tRNA 2-thiouridine(34) synthase MnmA [Bacilli bacterium]|nr:tRNA 2-thiouridine(34) synthase MnmA [Bacilli bacterium]
MKVVVGMSGGVDSAVAAYLLKKEGYDVVGLFMKNWDSNINNDKEGITEDVCPQELDYRDAKNVCDELCIPLYRVDFIKEYWDDVFKYFLDELEKGRTPNPDIMCNKYIKFDLFKKEAKKLGADKIATGHYARMDNGRLLRGIDSNKDQTYFLSQVSKEQLKDVLFPIGHLTKPEVRKIAKENNIPVYDKKDSTGICFIGERHYQNFVANYLKGKSGDIVDVETKKIVGKHKGLMNYTIGQRRNVGLSGDDKRHYVCGKDSKTNTLYVAYGEDSKYLLSDEAIIEDMNYISDKKPTEATAKFRYRSEDIPVSIEYIDNNHIRVKYKNSKAVTPGQACVIYDKEECIMGGIIKKVFKDNKELWYLK